MKPINADSIGEEARRGIELYRHKRAVIAMVQKLDCVKDAELIEAIRQVTERALRSR